MNPEEELHQLRVNNSTLREQVVQQQELIAKLTERIAALEEQLSKNSHNSYLPPSSDRFVRQPKSLRKKSGKKPGGQAGHPGASLIRSKTPDEIIVHRVFRCQHCQADLQAVPAEVHECRQVVDVPHPRLLVTEHQAEGKVCPHCTHSTLAAFPTEVSA